MGADDYDVESPRLSTVASRFSRVFRRLDFVVVLPILLCVYSVMKEIKVGEPFMYKYQTEYLNLTADQLTSEIYPYFPYSYLIALVPIFLLTDLFLYKPTMLMEVIGQIGYRFSLVFMSDVTSQKLGQVAYGLASASEVAFFSYIYARLEKDQYRKLTSWTRAGTMGGRSFGYFLSQLIILGGFGTYRTLNKIAFVFPCIVFVFCIFLPRVHWKVMVSRIAEARTHSKKKQEEKLPTSYLSYINYRARKLGSDFMKIYSVGFIRKWSFWWAMTTCMSLQVAQYAQTLWGEVQKDANSPLNGFAEAGYTFTATFAILAMNSFPINWDKWGETTLVLISSIDAALLLLYSKTNNIYVMYGCYIGYRSLYQVMITIAQWNIAKKMVCESYGLVFGANSFIALIMQSILMFVVADKRGFGMKVREQYQVYAGLHLLIAVIFAISVAYTVGSYFLCRKPKHVISPSKRSRSASRKSLSKSIVEPIELDPRNVFHDVDISSTALPPTPTAIPTPSPLPTTPIPDSPLPSNPHPAAHPHYIETTLNQIPEELDFDTSSDDELHDDDVFDASQRPVIAMPGGTMAASFSASFSKV